MFKSQAIGNIGGDAVQKTINGVSYASFSIAVSEKTKDSTKTTWIRVMKADREGKLTPYLTKGKKIWVSGRPHFSAYTNKNTNEPVADVTIWAEELEFCSSGEKQDGQPAQQAATAPQPQGGLDNMPPVPPAEDDDQLPF